MSVTVTVTGIEKDVEGFSVNYSLDYADGKTRVSVSYESREADEYEDAATAIESGDNYSAWGRLANGETSFEIREDGMIEFCHNGYGNGQGGALSVTLPAAPWGLAFREIARILRTGSAQ